MGYRDSDDAVAFEGKVEFTTAKAYLVEPTLGGQVWVPKSVVLSMEQSDGDGNFVFEVKEWWAKKNGMT